MARLELRAVTRTYPGGIAAARGIDLAVESGEFFVIVGPSGSGKSTLLRLIAGLEPLDSGDIFLGDRRIDGLPPRDRDLAMVFQDAVVYPHLSVFENIAFGLRARSVGRAEIKDRVEQVASSFGLTDTLKRSPTTLSGGQKRRVTLARAMVLRPGLYLFDEPFSGLDAPLRAAIRAELADLHRDLAATMILVTHDQAEALALADRIAVVDAGQVVQVGRPADVYDFPADRFVARFIGQPPMGLIPCTVATAGPASIRVTMTSGTGLAWSVARESRSGQILADRSGPLDLGLRAEAVAVAADVAPPGLPGPAWVLATARIVRLEPAGPQTIATLDLGGSTLSAYLPARTSLQVGATVAMAMDLDRACWFDRETGVRVRG